MHCYKALVLKLMLCCVLLISACAFNTPVPNSQPAKTASAEFVNKDPQKCPPQLRPNPSTCLTPRTLREAYGVDELTRQGYTGKGQTVVVVVSFGSPTMQKDLDTFSDYYGLPKTKVQVLAPLGTVSFDDPKLSDATKHDMVGWAGETTLDVQMIHALAPEAQIVVMTSPVSETEGTIGLPEFMKLEQYAVSHQLGKIVSQSWAASEATLADAASRKFLQQYSDFYKDATTTQGITFLAGSGDQGATDYTDLGATKLSPTVTVNFPASDPWVTAVGGTRLIHTGSSYQETVWSGSGGGVSKIFAEPDYQSSLPKSVQDQLGGHRGLPDVSADAQPGTQVAFYEAGRWVQIGGTSASAPLWAGIIAVADQMAGHSLGFINPGLYKIGQSSQQYANDFRDIMTGSNGVHQDGVNVEGFKAMPGWDAATGWGAPRANHLLPDLIKDLKS